MDIKIQHGIKWVISKLLRMLLYLGLAMIVVFCAYQYLVSKELWLEIKENNTRIKLFVPTDVTKSKDCKKFFEWQDQFLPKNMQHECPWEGKRNE